MDWLSVGDTVSFEDLYDPEVLYEANFRGWFFDGKRGECACLVLPNGSQLAIERNRIHKVDNSCVKIP